MTLLEAPAAPAPADAAPPAIEIDGLRIGYGGEPVVHDVELSIRSGSTLALVGQSGSGKSTIALAAAGLLPPGGAVLAGSVRIAGTETTGFSRRDWNRLRGSEIGFIPQDPLSSLDPLQRVGARIAGALRLHGGVDRRGAEAAGLELLRHVGMREPQRVWRAYPHELSGGQLQRVLIAVAISGKPSLLIADEPTSALDVTVQHTILDLIAALQAESGAAVLFITHDLALAGERADRIAVLNHGRIVDHGATDAVLSAPASEYTRQLFANAPALSPDKYRVAGVETPAAADPATEVIRIRGLVKRFPGAADPAVAGVDLTVREGTIHALVGESGSGKTTIARIVAGLTGFDDGAVRIGERGLPRHPPTTNRHAREAQLVYQNPLAAMNPLRTARQIIGEPLGIHGLGTAAERRARVAELVEAVALPAELLDRRPRALSGGQRQRVAIARALALESRVLVLDEPTSALDVTVQAQIIDLLVDLRDARGLSYLFISHDLSLVRQIADEVSVLEHGELVESGSVAEVFARPRHEYTRRLIDAVPTARRGAD